MISVSENFKNIVNSNVRPPIKPTITVSGTDVNGNNISLTWKSNNIIDMSYKRGIDPTGQTLPYMELTWKEFYFGKLNAQNYPEKYNNVAKYMKVDLWFEQDLLNINTWGDVLNGISYDEDTGTAKSTWNDFSSNTWNELTGTWDNPAGSTLSVVSGEIHNWGEYTPKTWGEVFKNQNKIKIKFPTLFLVARPVIEGHTITWSARDLLYFLNENVAHCFHSGIQWKNHLRWLLLNEIGNFSRNFDVVDGLRSSNNDIKNSTLTSLNRDAVGMVVFEGNTKNLLKNFALVQNFYLDFSGNKIIPKDFLALVRSSTKTPVFKFTKKIMREQPKLTQNTDISSFSIKRSYVQEKTDEQYQLEPAEVLTYEDTNGNSFDYGKYIYKGWGKSTAQSSQMGGFISKDAWSKVTDGADNAITVTPVEINDIIETWDNTDKKTAGEIYVEDNPLNYLGYAEPASVQKKLSLNLWHSSDKYSFELNSLSNVALEMGDLVEVETNLYDNSGNFLTKRAVIVGIEMTYNGTLKQKTLLHEVM